LPLRRRRRSTEDPVQLVLLGRGALRLRLRIAERRGRGERVFDRCSDRVPILVNQ
jgi:hypothetical protein